MLPEGLYNRRRRHNNTPQYALLIVANFLVCSVLFSITSQTNWFFFLVIIGLAVYNYFTVRRHIHEFTKPVIIAYAISLVALVFFFFITH